MVTSRQGVGSLFRPADSPRSKRPWPKKTPDPGGCHVFLADIYDPTDGVGDAPAARLPDWPDGLQIHAAYNEIIHRVAGERENVHVVPLYETFLGHGVHCTQPWRKHYRRDDPTYWYGANLEDPNIRGYDAARRVFLIEMAKVGAQLRSR